MRSTKKIFLVDDEIGIIQSLKRELYPWAIENNFALATARSGSQALEMVKEEPQNIALVISDIKMPDMRGSDLLLEVSALFPDIMTILLTGYAETEDMLKAIKAGIFSYILKPWDRFYLLGEVKKAIDIYTLKEENRRNIERMREELQWASELQRRILDVRPESTPLVSFDIRYEPIEELVCGGDYYDVLSSGDDRYLLAIGDVSGHGVRAAFVTSILKTVFGGGDVQRAVSQGKDPADLMSWLNTRICDELRNLPDVVIPLGLCAVDLAGQRLRFSSAGHLPVHVVRDGSVTPVRATGPALGFVRTIEYESTEFSLESGDRIVLFTDGLYRHAGGHPDGIDMLYDLMVRASNGSRFAEEFIEGARRLTQGGRFEDDATVLSMLLE